MKIRHSTPHEPLRARAYPSTGEQLDAIFKLAQALKEQGILLPPETVQWIDNCQAVKNKFVKNRQP